MVKELTWHGVCYPKYDSSLSDYYSATQEKLAFKGILYAIKPLVLKLLGNDNWSFGMGNNGGKTFLKKMCSNQRLCIILGGGDKCYWSYQQVQDLLNGARDDQNNNSVTQHWNGWLMRLRILGNDNLNVEGEFGSPSQPLAIAYTSAVAIILGG